uniref:Poly [ADP-ribose] polymerase n=1 Tax=Amphiprion ocellaris TaxID=80972 RepID=A0AAQ6ALA9_AMPOC
MVFLLGHTTQVEELSDTVIQFILDQVSVEGQVILPFPELVQLLPELLQLHKFDYSGVTLHPLTSSSGPRVALEGPANKVTDVRNRLGPLLDSLVQRRVTIDLPGAGSYFESPSGRDSILSVAQSKKCLMRLEEQPHASRQNSGFGKYCLQDGLQVLVCEGDITKQYTDVLVNAANEDLDHHGGVAAALSKAGGPEVQKESKALVKRTGKIKTGDVVVTTGGNLKCKKLLHAVGPIGGKAGGKERDVLPELAQTTDCLTGITYKVKRSQSDAGMSRHILQTIFFYECVSKILILILVASASALRLPEHWDPMQEEVFKKVELQPNSPEYQDVAQGFFKTAKYNISKIERVQNLYLWHSYSVCRQRILTKNGEAELGEKFLYHGTSAESCNCIERDRFDRSFAGAHAAMYGKGVYFAVDANYSASRYSPADPSGLKRLYVARVLTGRYTVGTSSMKATPPRGSDPTDCFDSLVNNQQQPSMFVIFHDDQAYPEYLITFS